MGTHCYIALEQFDGSIIYIYCHYDGYLSSVGKLLFQYYKKRNNVLTLIKNGSMLSLGVPIIEMSPCEPIEHMKAHDRFHFEDEFYKQVTISYYYLFTQNNEWECKVKHTLLLADIF